MSHLQHADYSGAMLPMDRETRSPERRDALHLAHLSRLIMDTLVSELNRLTVGYLFAGEDLKPVNDATAAVNDVRASFGGAYERWTSIEYAPK